jgi:predicted TIM-barrel fold metal-dependent hydrolase
MIIDSHGHSCGEYVTLEKLLAKLDKNHIDKVVLFPGEIGNEKIDKIPDSKNKEKLYISNVIGEFLGRFMQLQKQIHFGNRYVYYLSQLRPDKIIQFYWLTPQYISELEADFVAMKFAGIKLHQCIRYFSIQSDFFQQTIDFAEKHQLPIIIHLYGRKDALNLINVVQHRKVKIIVAHLLFYKDFYRHWHDVSEQISFDLANYYFINPETIRAAISYFGCDKLIFGSDSKFGENCIERTITMINALPVSQAEKDKIFGQNMYEILGADIGYDRHINP